MSCFNESYEITLSYVFLLHKIYHLINLDPNRNVVIIIRIGNFKKFVGFYTIQNSQKIVIENILFKTLHSGIKKFVISKIRKSYDTTF